MTDKSDLLERCKILNEQFQKLLPTLDLEKKKTELETYKEQMNQSDFWNNPDEAQQVSQKAAHLEHSLKSWNIIQSFVSEAPELIDISEDNEIGDIEQELCSMERQFNKSETQTLLSGEYDNHNVILKISTGNGGQDAEDFSQMIYRMYLRFAEQKGWKTTILDESPSDVGLKSAMIEIKGLNAYGLMKSEHGVHRLIRLSPFNAKSLRQTSFSRVEILPEIKQDTDIDIAESDIRIDVFRASGCGGQSVNTTDSAVRITYLPLNISVSCQNEKSQLQNKAAAMKVLKSRLLQLKLEQNAKEINELRGAMMENSFGSQIRTYTLQPYKLVKDHRTNFEHSNPDKVFNGDIDGFIEAFLRQ